MRAPALLMLAEGRRTSRGTLGGLWAKREWWRRWGNDAIIPAMGIYPGDPRGVCEVTGVFPALHWPNW